MDLKKYFPNNLLTLIICYLSLIINHWNLVCFFCFFKLHGFFCTNFFLFILFKQGQWDEQLYYTLVFHKPPSTFLLHNKSMNEWMNECGFDSIVVEILFKHRPSLCIASLFHSFIHIPSYEYYLLKLKTFSFNLQQTIHFSNF